MDDIPFFESTGYQHRGGIWPDAVRRQYSPENDDPSTAPATGADLSALSDSSVQASSSAPPSIIGLATDTLQSQPSPNPLPVSDSTPTIPLSPKSKTLAPTAEPSSVSTEGPAPASNAVRSRTPSPAGVKVDSAVEHTKETGLKKDGENEKIKIVTAPEVVYPKRTSWFSLATPVSVSSPSSADNSRGRTTNAGPGSTGKSTPASVRGRSAPRASPLPEVEGGLTNTNHFASNPTLNSNIDSISSTSTQANTAAPSEAPTQDTLPNNQSNSSKNPTPMDNDAASRSTTPVLTINGTRRATTSHQASRSASGNFYSGGSVSSSSLPPTEPSPTVPYSDSEPVKVPGTPPEASTSSAASSLNTPLDLPNVGIIDSNELSRTLSNSSTHSLSEPISLATSTAVDVSPAAPHNMNNTPNSTSFLTAWKARDKQALGGAAKEAMKKWSVGWNNLKRGVEEERERRRVGNYSSGTGAGGSARGDISGVEDDGSGSDAGMGGVGSGPMKAAGKKTYAELRAGKLAMGCALLLLLIPHLEVMSRREGTSTPVDAKDTGASGRDSPFSGGESSSPKPRPTSISVTPSAPRTTTEVHTGSPGLFEEPKSIVKQPKPTPIGVQPGRAATMMIPGIHASHQGEVMALGSTPAEKELASKDKVLDKTVERERTLSQNGRPSSIQNVYRLFGQRTISTGSSDAPNLSGSKIEIVKQPKAAASSASIDTISVTPVDDQPSDSPFSPSTPRSNTPALFPALHSASNTAVPTPRSSPPALPPRKQSVIMSAASEALKKLAAEDAARTSRPQSPQVPITSEETTSGMSTPNGTQPSVSPPSLPPREPVTAS
jgi:hypothetical protein